MVPCFRRDLAGRASQDRPSPGRSRNSLCRHPGDIRTSAPTCSTKGREIGVHYGISSARAELTTSETIEVFLYFRYPVVKALLDVIEKEGLPARRASRLFIGIDDFIDEVLVAMIRAHGEESGFEPRRADLHWSQDPFRDSREQRYPAESLDDHDALASFLSYVRDGFGALTGFAATEYLADIRFCRTGRSERTCFSIRSGHELTLGQHYDTFSASAGFPPSLAGRLPMTPAGPPAATGGSAFPGVVQSRKNQA